MSRAIAAWNLIGRARQAGEKLSAWAKREMPNTQKYIAFRKNQFLQNVIQPAIDRLGRTAVARTHKAIDATETGAARALAANAAQKAKVDFTSAARNPPRVSRLATTAKTSAGDLVKVRIGGLPPKTPRPTRKR